MTEEEVAKLGAGYEEAREIFEQVATRDEFVEFLTLPAYDRLAYNAGYENIDLVAYLREVIDDVVATVAPCKVQFHAPKEIQFAADRAILLALIVNELVLNAGKYAYPENTEGSISVRLDQADKNSILISISDDGVGLLRRSVEASATPGAAGDLQQRPRLAVH